MYDQSQQRINSRKAIFLLFSERHKPRNASLAIQQEQYIKKQVQLHKKEGKSRYLTPKKQNQSFQTRLLDLPIISQSLKNQLCITQIFTQMNENQKNPHQQNWNIKFDSLLCGTLRNFSLTKEQKLLNKSFSREEQQEIVETFKQKPPIQITKLKRNLQRNCN